MPYVVEFNMPAIKDKLNFLGHFLDLPDPSAVGVVAWIRSLRETLDIPDTLTAMGLVDIDVDKVAAMGAVDPCAGGNPVPLDPDGLKRILRAAIG